MQDRKTYAKGSTLESTTGYIVKVGMPVVDDTVKATSNGATFTQNAPLTDGQYLVTLEVNGEAVAYKESITADSGITVGDYSVAENAGKIVLSGASANDIVRLLIEPLEVNTTAAFRAAVKKDAPEAPNELPTVTSADAGKVLGVNDSGVWGAQEPIGKQFIVTLTPTAQDYSGTMDKTVAEINAAYEAGQEIWFKIAVGSDWTVYPLSRGGKVSAFTYPSFNCNALYDENNVLVMIYTATTNDGTKQTYSTKVYTLTPAT